MKFKLFILLLFAISVTLMLTHHIGNGIILFILSLLLFCAYHFFRFLFQAATEPIEVPNDDPEIPDVYQPSSFLYDDCEERWLLHSDSGAWLSIKSTTPLTPESLNDDSNDAWSVVSRTEEEKLSGFGKVMTERRKNGLEFVYDINIERSFEWLLEHDIVQIALNQQCWERINQCSVEGNPEAKSIIGSIMAHAIVGHVTPRVIALWEEAAESGVVDAMRELATYYWNQSAGRYNYTEEERRELKKKAIYWNSRGGCHVFSVDRLAIELAFAEEHSKAPDNIAKDASQEAQDIEGSTQNQQDTQAEN